MSSSHVGVTEIGEMFNITRQRANALTKKPGFPAPAIESRAGRLWERSAVEEWGRTWDRTNRGGRPPKADGPSPGA